MEKICSDCLICRQNVPNSCLKPDQDWPEILLRIFGKFCRIFQVKFPADLKNWDFSKEAFPFCKSCRSQVVSLCKLEDQLELIQKSIDKISAQLAVKLLESENGGDRSGDGKHEYFRDSIKRRYDVRVRLKDLKREEMGKAVAGLMSMSAGKSGCSVKSHSSSSSSNLAKLSSGLSLNKMNGTNRGVNALSMTADDNKDDGESLEGNRQMKTFSRARTRSESPQPIRLIPLEAITEPMDTDEDSVYDNGTDSDPLGFTNPHEQVLFEQGEASISNAYVEIQQPLQIHQTFYDEAGTEDEPFQLPAVDVVLEEPEIDEEYLYPPPRHVPRPDLLPRSAPRSRLPVTVLTPSGTQVPQGRTPPTQAPKPAIYKVVPPNTTLRNFKNRKGVILVDEKTSTYSYAGFTFVKMDDRCVCNSCGASLKLRAQSDHHVNIRNHINSVHVEKRDAPQLPHLILPPPILQPGQAAVINLE